MTNTTTPTREDAYRAGYVHGARDADALNGFQLGNDGARSSDEGYASGYYDGFDGRRTTLSITIPATDQQRDEALAHIRQSLRAVPTEHLIAASAAALDEFNTRKLPTIEVTNDDGIAGLACPWAGCDGTEVQELDASERINPTELQDGVLVTYQGDGNYETIYWACNTCGRPVGIPEDVEVEWS